MDTSKHTALDKSLENIQCETVKLIMIAKCFPEGHSNSSRKIDEFDKYLE